MHEKPSNAQRFLKACDEFFCKNPDAACKDNHFVWQWQYRTHHTSLRLAKWQFSNFHASCAPQHGHVYTVYKVHIECILYTVHLCFQGRTPFMCCAKLHMVWLLGISIQAIFCVSHLSESLLSSCHACDILIWAKLRAHQVVLFPPSHAVTFESCVFKSDCSILQLHRVQEELCFKKMWELALLKFCQLNSSPVSSANWKSLGLFR